jgi:phosphatidylserine/phosphatidylglycerophosphate/cardiolipin synthase-like enzyme
MNKCPPKRTPEIIFLVCIMPKKPRQRRKVQTSTDDLNAKLCTTRCLTRVVTSVSGTVEVHFGLVAERMRALIGTAHAVVGCMAWLTDTSLRDALALCPGGVSIVVTNDTIPPRVKAMHKSLPVMRGHTHAVHRIGSARGKMRALMHHKFLVGLDAEHRPLWCSTGSYNATMHSRRNAENMVVLYDPDICGAYHQEYVSLHAFAT